MEIIDYHIHCNYSDGSDIESMVKAASELGLSAIGFADHCNVTDETRREKSGYTLNSHIEERHEEIDKLEESYNVRIFEGVEMDYYPWDKSTIRRELGNMNLDYSLGSIHYIHEKHLQNESYFGSLDVNERKSVVNEYFDKLVDLINSELFDVVAHIDLPERNQYLRGIASNQHFHQVAEALVSSRTKPEMNYGRITGSYGKAHPSPEFLGILESNCISFVAGSDAHTPKGLKQTHRYITENIDRSYNTLPGLEP